METLNPSTAGAYAPNERNIETHRFYYGCYLNMARHNAYIILHHIQESWKETTTIPAAEENLQNSIVLSWLGKKNTPSRTAFAATRLRHHFPMLQKLADDELGTTMKTLLEQLNVHRNYYCHAFSAAEKIKGITSISLAEKLKTICENAVEGAQKRHAQYLGEATATAFTHLQDAANPYYRFIDAEEKLSEKGLAYFICLFLEKKYAELFISKIRGLKRADEKNFRATKLAYTQFCCNLPYPKIKSGDAATGLLLDIVSELHRPPDELYHHLNETDQKAFLGEVDKEAVNYADDEEAPPLPVMKRYEDRFPYLAMRFLDETETLDKLRFQLFIGQKIIKAPKHKQLFDVPFERYITKDIKTFKRLPYLLDANNLPGNWQIRNNDDVVIPNPTVFRQYAPHYNINEYSIALGMESGPLEKLNAAKTEQEKPLAYLSLYDLPQFALYALLHKEGVIQQSPEALIENFSKNVLQLFKDVAGEKLPPLFTPPTLSRKKLKAATADLQYSPEELEELQKRKDALEQLLVEKYGLYPNDLPDQIKFYLLGYRGQDILLKFKTNLKAAIYEGNDLLKKTAKVNARERIKSGVMATWLMNDLIHLIPPAERQKIRDYHYNEFQSSLAYFSIQKENIATFIKDYFSKHPFINHINLQTAKGIFDFYIQYLQIKVSYYTRLKDDFGRSKKAKKGFEFIEKHAFLIGLTEKEIQDIRDNQAAIKNARNLVEHAVVLPRGFFNTDCIEAIKTNENKIDEIADNFYHALDKYLSGDKQGYYSFERTYTLDESQEVKGRTGTDFENQYHKFKKALKPVRPKQELPIENIYFKRFKKKIAANEQVLRFRVTQDRLLFLMFKKLVEKTGTTQIKNADKLKLSAIKGCTSELLNADFSQHLQFEDKQIEIDTKIKRLGICRRYLKDRRMSSLIKYFPDHVIPFNFIETELNNYETARESIMEAINDLEKNLQPFATAWMEEQVTTNGYVSFSRLLEQITKALPATKEWEEKLAALLEIRNKFSHNQFPVINTVDIGGLNIANSLVFVFLAYTNDLITELKK